MRHGAAAGHPLQRERRDAALLTAIVVLVAFVYGPDGSESRVYAASNDFDRQLHESLGMVVLALAVIRVVWRLAAATPALPALPGWMTMAARGAQIALYVLMFALPATAAAGAWLEGHPLTLLAGVRIGPLLPESHALGSAIAEVHTWLGDAIMWVAGVHAAAALFHHFVLRDDVLASMLPGWLRLPRPD